MRWCKREGKTDMSTLCVSLTERNHYNSVVWLSFVALIWYFFFQLLLHNPVETPKIADYGSLVAPGREYRIKIKPTINNAAESLHSVKEINRQCAYSGDKYLLFYKTYTERNCMLECEANYTLLVCNCVPFYLPSTWFTIAFFLASFVFSFFLSLFPASLFFMRLLTFLFPFKFLRVGWERVQLERRLLIGLLYQPRMINDNCGTVVEWELADETEVHGKNLR
jgi:hypothetical protein